MTEPTTPPDEGARWRGFTHRDLYLMLHDGPGAAASAEPSRRWGEIASTLTEIGQDLQKALDLTGSGWTGRAAGAAYSRLSTTVAWASATGTSAGAMRTAVEDQANHIAKARAEMPKPEDVPATQPDPTVAPAVQVVQAQTDAEAAEAAASSAEERAVEVMTAYETSSSGTTGGLATFAKPDKLLPSTGLHQGDGNGFLGLGLGVTAVAGLAGGPRRDDDQQRDGRGGRGGPGGTHGANAPWEESRQRSTSPLPGPGRTTGVSTDPYFAAGRGNSGRSQETPRRGNMVGAGPSGGSGGSGGLPGGPKTGLGGLPTPELQQAQQAAAANQAAAQHASGAPIAPTAGGPAGAHEKMAMRRFGMEAIGSSQWFGDAEEPVPGQSPKRRFDLRQTEDDANESASILDEENQLPPGVIGEGGR
jgi:hypothetical protein